MLGLLRFGFIATAFSAMVVATLGCGGGDSFPEGPTGTLSGTATLDDAPLPAGTSITFIHTKTSQPAVAVVEQGGAYTAKMRNEAKVLAGDYRVSVADPTQPTPSPEELAREMEAVYTGKAQQKPTGVVPAKYSVPETSGLTVVVAEGANTFDIALTSK